MKRTARKQVGTMAPDGTDPIRPATHTVADNIGDDIGGTQARASAEESDPVQVFVRRLVEDYGYSKNQIQTHPPYRIRVRLSDEDRSFPVDIAVFRSSHKTAAELFMVVECRQRERKDGEHQLRLYLDKSAAEVGVWFTGSEHLYLRRIHHPDGRRTYEVLPNLPRQGQRIEDIGLLRRKDLRKPSHLKAVFRDLRNHLAGMTRGITRDETLAQEMINLLFCKILDEQETAPDAIVTFRAGVGESPEDIQKRILALFERVKGAACGDIFNSRDTIRLDPDSLAYVVGELQNYCITEAERDAIGDAFEVFIGPALRGSEGQFFTPRNVVEMMVKIVDPRPGERIIDPACGSGGFLVHALAHVCSQPHGNTGPNEHSNEWSAAQQIRCRPAVAHRCFVGIEKDAFLAKVCQAYLDLVGDGCGAVFCANGLEPFEDWPEVMRQTIAPGSFDVVLTNPPFGKKIVVRGAKLLAQFELGHKWKRNRETGALEKTATLHEDQPPQVLFLERCLQLLRPGGRLGIVLPEAVFGMPTYEYVVSWLRGRAKIRGVVSLPEALFKTSGKGGTHAKVCVLFVENTRPGKDEDYAIFMADVKWCGHDSRGNPTIRKDRYGNEILLDEVPVVYERWSEIIGKW